MIFYFKFFSYVYAFLLGGMVLKYVKGIGDYNIFEWGLVIIFFINLTYYGNKDTRSPHKGG